MAFAIDLLVVFISLATVCAYAWSLRAHFNSPGMALGAKIISGGAMLAAAVFAYLVLARPQPMWVELVGLALECCSALLFCWAIATTRSARLRFAFDPEEPRGLVTDGPYRYVRHPFYTSYLLFWSGWAIATATPWTAPVVIAFCILYVSAARREERLFAGSAMAEAYDGYRRGSGFMLPRLSNLLLPASLPTAR